MMTHRGYTGLIIAVDQDDGELYGHVVGIRNAVLTFVGKTFAEAKACFERTVDDYLTWAAEGWTIEEPDPAVVAACVAAEDAARSRLHDEITAIHHRLLGAPQPEETPCPAPSSARR